MKRVVIAIIITMLIAISGIFIFITFKNNKSTKYSHNDIVNLINKGLQSMDNISFTKTNQYGTTIYYYKQGKIKMTSSASRYIYIEKDGKTYGIDKEKKFLIISPKSLIINGGLQYDTLNIERLNSKLTEKDNFRYEFVYIRDEKLDNKDCIFVKETEYNIDTKKYSDRADDNGDTTVYWIDKPTGMVIGGGFMQSGKNTAEPNVIISNIEFDGVSDDIFNDIDNLPSDYKKIYRNEEGTVERVE